MLQQLVFLSAIVPAVSALSMLCDLAFDQKCYSCSSGQQVMTSTGSGTMLEQPPEHLGRMPSFTACTIQSLDIHYIDSTT